MYIHTVCAHTHLSLSTPANQLDCVPNIKNIVSKGFGHSGILL